MLAICSAWENYEPGVQRNKRLIEGRCAVLGCGGENHTAITGQGAHRGEEKKRVRGKPEVYFPVALALLSLA